MTAIKSEYTIVDGQRYFMTKPGGSTTSDNKNAGLMIAENYKPALSTDPRIITIDSAAKVITDITAPLEAEIFIINNFKTGAKFATITFNYQEGGIPYTPMVMVSLNASDIGTAIQRFTVTDIAAGGTSTTNQGQPAVSAQKAVLELSTFGTDATIDTIHLGALAPTGTAVNPVTITIEVQ